jgi:hypothetical protein
MLADAVEAVGAEIVREVWVAGDPQNAFGKTLRLVGLDQEAAARLFYDLSE